MKLIISIVLFFGVLFSFPRFITADLKLITDEDWQNLLEGEWLVMLCVPITYFLLEWCFMGATGYQELSSPGGTFVPGNFRPLELSFPGTKVPWNFCLLVSFHRTFDPCHIILNFRSSKNTDCLTAGNLRLMK